MKLNAKVIETISASEYTDKKPRVKLKVAEADSCFRTFIVPNADKLLLDQSVMLLTLEEGFADSILWALTDSKATERYEILKMLADRLRPDDAATTLEFKLGGTA